MDNLKLSQQNPAPQCAVCRTNDFATLDKVCHRCGRALCTIHPGADPPDFKRFGDIEFSGLDLRGAAQRVVYCQTCANKIRRGRQLWREMAAKLHQSGLKLLLFGAHRPPVPAIPAIRRVAMSEGLTGQYTLMPDGKVEFTKFDTADGKLTIDVEFAEHDRARLAAYLGKYSLRNKDNLIIHAGFVLLKNMTNLQSDAPTSDDYPQAGLFALRKPITALPFFASKPPSSDNDDKRVFTYTVKRSDGKEIPLPLQIVPSLVDDHGQQALELDIQLRPDVARFIDFESARIKEFLLELPGTIDPLSAIVPPPTSGSSAASPSNHIRTWTALKPLSKKNPLVSIRLGLQAEIQPTSTLKGKLVVSFNGTLSGSQEIRYYTSWGQLANTPELQRATEVKGDFALNLQSLVQHTLKSRSAQVPCRGISLTADLIAALTQRLSEQGLYIRRVVEEPARPSRGDAKELHLVWDIAGRQYDSDLHPLDFHLLLRGTAVIDRPERNELMVDCTVQGGGPKNGPRQQQVEALLGRLTTIVKIVCQLDQLQRRQENERRQQERWTGSTPDFN
ncbi:MAG TPA: hypothetical protein PKE45_20715 [Caldilineaceae bacterium]|nr:hypothetical protein [Caldilineaceae bacterium]